MTDKEEKALNLSADKRNRIIEEYAANKEAKSLNFIFSGEPIAYSRPRYHSGSGGNFGFFYNPKSKIEHIYSKSIRQQLASEKWLTELVKNVSADYMVSFSFKFYMPIRTTASVKDIILEENGIKRPSSIRKKDLDNLIKPWLDIFNLVAYDDDKRVMNISADKYFSVNPRVEITIDYTIFKK
jgi:Holliday junction resolvase RusA-like endonuclease